MKGIKFLISLLFVSWSLNLDAQSLMPPLHENQTAQIYIQKEIVNLELIIKYNPTTDLERKLYMYQQALGFLQAPQTMLKTTEEALIQSFVITEMKWNYLDEAPAQEKYEKQQWSKEFVDLIVLVKI